jgi:hypothetical protein
MPALDSSSLNRVISVSICSVGMTPASDSLLAFTRIMKRMMVSRFRFGVGPSRGWPAGRARLLYPFVGWRVAKSTSLQPSTIGGKAAGL